jgi:hypothetical protein
MRRTILAFATLAMVALAAPLPGQHIAYPTADIERMLGVEPLQVLSTNGSRGEGDRTQQAALGLGDNMTLLAKWARAPQGGEEYNNNPRYEVAAYEIQKLFLSEPDYAVPPTVLRSFPLAWYRAEYQPDANPTFGRSESVFVVLQYWLNPPVAPHNEVDQARLRTDPIYQHHLANFNVVTHLINHNDANLGNFLISETPDARIFSVDNGVAFRSIESDRGNYWRDLRVDRIPASTAERLRQLTLQDLERHLGVLAQFELRNGHYERVEPSANLAPNEGIRRVGDVLQFGLTAREIQDVNGRLARLVQQLQAGRIGTF